VASGFYGQAIRNPLGSVLLRKLDHQGASLKTMAATLRTRHLIMSRSVDRCAARAR